MSCKNCGKSDRHLNKDVDSKERKSMPAPPRPQEMNPFDSLLASKKLTYEQLKRRVEEQYQYMDDTAEKVLAEMTEPMKRIQVEMLVDVINCETASFANVTPDQAVYTLKKYLDRPDFEEVRKLYPTLKEQVNERYTNILERRIKLV